ncbi:serine hydrolase [Streptomyces alkaliphilus]|uniref:serine hydrolase n=1 Tax=Streptomyces alkaliphilus TaxID=1472722 RepID=UPI001564B61E
MSHRPGRRTVPAAAVVVGLAGAVLMAAAGEVSGATGGNGPGASPPGDVPSAATPIDDPVAPLGGAVIGTPGPPDPRNADVPTPVSTERLAARTAGAQVPTPRTAPDRDADTRLAAALAALDPPAPVRLSVRAVDPATGTVVSAGNGSFDTASIVKVNIVAALLFLRQEEGREPGAEEMALASAAIRYSDNAATDGLWRLIGGAEGLDALNSRWGLTRTTGGEGGHWGLTRTTGDDQLRLLEIVFGSSGPLTPASRAVVQELMGEVAEGQRWGISAAAAPHPAGVPTGTGEGTMAGFVAAGELPETTDPPITASPGGTAGTSAGSGGTRLKNGWLPRSHTRLWDINSIGRVTVDGRPILMVVLSDGHTGREEGITVVEAAARAAATALTGAGTPQA